MVTAFIFLLHVQRVIQQRDIAKIKRSVQQAFIFAKQGQHRPEQPIFAAGQGSPIYACGVCFGDFVDRPGKKGVMVSCKIAHVICIISLRPISSNINRPPAMTGA